MEDLVKIVFFFLLISVEYSSGYKLDPASDKFSRDINNLYLLCNPCDANTLALKLSAYLRFMQSKRSAFLEDDRNKFAEEAPWYLGKRSGPRSFIDYPRKWKVVPGKRDAEPYDESVQSDDEMDLPNYFRPIRAVGGNWWSSQSAAGPSLRSADKWNALRYQGW